MIATVVGVLFCITLMLVGLWQMPGGVIRVEKSLEIKQQAIYDAESRIIMQLKRLPLNTGEPAVTIQSVGPWAEFFTPVQSGDKSWGRLRVVAGLANDSISRDDRRHIVESFRQSLMREILLGENIKTKSGNRRLLGEAKSMSLVVQDGDLLVDMFGSALVCNFKASGSLTVRGRAVFDTLRIYASGPITLSGDVRVKWLEAYSVDQVEVERNFNFSGAIMANNAVTLSQHALAQFPSALISLNASVAYEKRNIEKGLLLPAIEKEIGGHFYGSSHLIPFSWSME